MKIIILLLITTLSYSQCPGMCGDAMGDGDIDPTDATAIAQYYADMNPQPFCPENADCDMDNEITILDALLVSRCYVGLITCMPCQEPIEYQPTPPITISWDCDSEPAGYNFYFSYHNPNDPDYNHNWNLYSQPIDINEEFIRTELGRYIFGVQAKYMDENDNIITSTLHTSLDDNAEPCSGWYVRITE